MMETMQSLCVFGEKKMDFSGATADRPYTRWKTVSQRTSILRAASFFWFSVPRVRSFVCSTRLVIVGVAARLAACAEFVNEHNVYLNRVILVCPG